METFAPREKIHGQILPQFVLDKPLTPGAKALYAPLCNCASENDHCQAIWARCQNGGWEMTVQYTPSKQNRIFALPEGKWMDEEIAPFWEKTFDELKTILLAWLQGSRSIWVFSDDDPFNSPANPLHHADYFQLEGQDILIVPPEDLTIEFLHAAFLYTYPIYIFKTNGSAKYIKDVFKKSILPKEQQGRDSHFSIKILYDFLGEFISVLAMAYFYRIEEKDFYLVK